MRISFTISSVAKALDQNFTLIIKQVQFKALDMWIHICDIYSDQSRYGYEVGRQFIAELK